MQKNETKVIWNKTTILHFIIGVVLQVMCFIYVLIKMYYNILYGLFLLLLISAMFISAICFMECDKQQTKHKLNISILDFDELICTNCNESLNYCSCENGDMKAKCKKCDSTDIHFCKAELMEWGYSQKVFCNNCGINMWLDC